MNEEKNPLILSKKIYDPLKFLAQIFLPAFGTLYFTLAGLWNLPAPDAVVGTILAVDTFIGVILGISSSAYNTSDSKYGGVINVSTGDDKQVFSLVVHGPPEDISSQKEITFKVNPDTD